MTPAEARQWLADHAATFPQYGDWLSKHAAQTPLIVEAMLDHSLQDAEMVTRKMQRGQLDEIHVYQYEAVAAIVSRHCRDAERARRETQQRETEQRRRDEMTRQRESISHTMSRLGLRDTWERYKAALIRHADIAEEHRHHVTVLAGCPLCDLLESIP